MKIIISPAKKMNRREDDLEYKDLPVFLEQTRILMEAIQSLTLEQARRLWNCNEAIAQLNYERFHPMDLTSRLTPAILSYEGIQYQYMAPRVFQTQELSYVQENLRIISGFYGLLRPLDGVVPYRLEMQAKLSVNGHKDLYDFWNNAIARELMKDDHILVNLASKEYSKAVIPWLPSHLRLVEVDFCSMVPDRQGVLKPKTKATEAKMARGEMVRYLAEHQIQSPEDMAGFNRLGYSFSQELSAENHFVFIKN